MAGTQSKVYSQTQVKPTFILEDGSGKRHTPKSASDMKWGLGLKYGYAHGAGSAAPYATTVENAEPAYSMKVEHDDFRALLEHAGAGWLYKTWTIQFTATAANLDTFNVTLEGCRLGGDEESGAVHMVEVGAPCTKILHDNVDPFEAAA